MKAIRANVQHDDEPLENHWICRPCNRVRVRIPLSHPPAPPNGPPHCPCGRMTEPLYELTPEMKAVRYRPLISFIVAELVEDIVLMTEAAAAGAPPADLPP